MAKEFVLLVADTSVPSDVVTLIVRDPRPSDSVLLPLLCKAYQRLVISA
jgi:hypothetical protein